MGANITYDSVSAELKSYRVDYKDDVATIVAEIYLTYSYTASKTIFVTSVTASGGGNDVKTITCSASKNEEMGEKEE